MINKIKDTWLFVALTYFLTGVAWGLLALLKLPATESFLAISLYLLGGFSTIIVAFFVVLLNPKRERPYYWSTFFKFKISVKWYVITFVCASALVVTAYLVNVIRQEGDMYTFQPFYMMIPFFIMMIVGGGVEEFGWRGIMVHNLKHLHPLFVSLLVGVVWFIWHIPLFYIVGVGQYGAPMLPFFIAIIAYSLVLTAIYYRTKSVILSVMFHALINAYAEIGFWATSERVLAMADSLTRLGVGMILFVIILYGNRIMNKR